MAGHTIVTQKTENKGVAATLPFRHNSLSGPGFFEMMVLVFGTSYVRPYPAVLDFWKWGYISWGFSLMAQDFA